MRTSELLAQAFGLWSSMPTTGAYMKDKDGHSLDPYNPVAPVCSVCSMGAIYRVAGMGHERTYDATEYLNRAAMRLTNLGGIIGVNDHASFEVTSSVWLKAIELAKAEEGCAV